MFRPDLLPWMIQADGDPISQDRRNVRPLVPITDRTRVRKIVQSRRATVLHADDVVQMKEVVEYRSGYRQYSQQ